MKKEFTEFVQCTRPKARSEAIIQGPDYRFTVLTDRLIRLEYQPEGRFMDDATQRVICREFPVPGFRIRETEQKLEIITEEFHLYYDKKPFSPEGLQIHYTAFGAVWYYGDPADGLRGTARTLDGADGAVTLEQGLISRDGFLAYSRPSCACTAATVYFMEKNRGTTAWKRNGSCPTLCACATG